MYFLYYLFYYFSSKENCTGRSSTYTSLKIHEVVPSILSVLGLFLLVPNCTSVHFFFSTVSENQMWLFIISPAEDYQLNYMFILFRVFPQKPKRKHKRHNFHMLQLEDISSTRMVDHVFDRWDKKGKQSETVKC